MKEGRTSTASSAKTTRMRALAIPTAVSTARPPGGKQSSVTWATPPWRTAMGWRWRAFGLSDKCIDCFSIVSVFSFLHLIWKLTQLAKRLELGLVAAERLHDILRICQSWLRRLVGRVTILRR